MSWLEDIKSAFRDWVVEGVPASGEYEPDKAAIRAAFDQLAVAISALGGGLLRFETKALLDADTTEADGQLAYVYDDAVAENNTVYQSVGGVWTEAAWYFDAVAAVVQPLVDDAEAAAATSQALSDAFTRIPDQPNVFSDEQLGFNDLSIWTSTAPVTAEIRGGRRCLKVEGGSATASFPASAFEETGLISASLWIEEVVFVSGVTRLRITQRDGGGASLLNSTITFGNVSFAESQYFEIAGIVLDDNCVSVDFVIQAGDSGAGGAVWAHNLLLAQGDSARYRLPSFDASFDEWVEQSGVLQEDDLTIDPSDNLARPEYLIDGQYIGNEGQIVVAADWKTYRVPVVPGEQYSFGNFLIDVAGYSAFYTAGGSLAQYNGSHSNASLPKTYTAPAGAAWLYVTVARPTNLPEDWAQTVINEGDTLLPYEPPVDTVTAIAGYRVAGDVDTDAFAKLGEDADFDALAASSLTTSALVANLPSGATRPAEVDINEVWIDTSVGGTDAPLKVRLS